MMKTDTEIAKSSLEKEIENLEYGFDILDGSALGNEIEGPEREELHKLLCGAIATIRFAIEHGFKDEMENGTNS